MHMANYNLLSDALFSLPLFSFLIGDEDEDWLICFIGMVLGGGVSRVVAVRRFGRSTRSVWIVCVSRSLAQSSVGLRLQA